MIKKSFIMLFVFLLKNMIVLGEKGSLKIEVKDKKSKEAIEFATVKVSSQAGFLKNVTTNAEGNVVVDSLIPGIYFVEIFYLGYGRDSSSVEVGSKPVVLKRKMESFTIVCSEVVILGNDNIGEVTNCIIRCFTGCCGFHPVSRTELKTDSVQEEEKISTIQKIKCYPSPTNGILFVEPGSETKEISVIDITGKVIQKQILNDQEKLTLDMSSYTPGVYFINCVYQDKVFSERIVITR